jgi:hypothetical protein
MDRGIIHFPFPGGEGTLVFSITTAPVEGSYEVSQGFYRIVLKGAGGGIGSSGAGYEGGKIDTIFL